MSHEFPNAVETFLERFRRAWDAGDAAAYAALFTANASYVIFLGEAMVGREEIARNHADVFAHWQKGTRMAVKAISIQPLGADIGTFVTVGGIATENPIALDKVCLLYTSPSPRD